MPRPVHTILRCNSTVVCPSHDIHWISLSQNVFGHHKFDILLPFDQVENPLAPFFIDAHTRLLGQPLWLQAETDAAHFFSGTQQLLFQGLVTELDTGKDNEFAGSVRLRGYSPCQLLDSGRKKRTFVKQTLDEIFKKVLNPFPVNVLSHNLVPQYRQPLPYVVQYEETDYDFLRRLAAEYGEWFYYDGRTLHLGPPAAEEAVDFWADGHHNSFRFGLTAQPAKERLSAYNYRDHTHFQRATAQQGAADGTGPGAMGYAQVFAQHALMVSEKLYEESQQASRRGAQQPDELDHEAQTRRATTTAGLVTVQGTSDRLDLQLGSVLDIRGEGIGTSSLLPESFGKYRITAITHTIDGKNNYGNTFTAVPWQSLVPPADPAATGRVVVGMPELAEVIDDQDPARLGRLRVRYYWPVQTPQDAETDWIRGVTPYSGDGKGLMFNPEVGSQVMVACEAGLAEKPFMLGNMQHANNREGATHSRPDNHVKAVHSSLEGGNKLTMNDLKGALGILLSNSNNKDTAMQLGFDGNGNVTIKTLGPVHVSGSSITLEAGPLGEIHMHARRISMVAEQEIMASSVAKDIVLIAKETLAYQAKQVSGKAEDTMHLDGGQRLTSSSDDSYYL